MTTAAHDTDRDQVITFDAPVRATDFMLNEMIEPDRKLFPSKTNFNKAIQF